MNRLPEDATLGGYISKHERPPAFEGSDGEMYSVATYVDDTPDAEGNFGGALLFVRWGRDGSQPVGHLETGYLCVAAKRIAADRKLRALTLQEVKEQLERAIKRSGEAGPR